MYVNAVDLNVCECEHAQVCARLAGPQATSVCGLQLLVYEADSEECVARWAIVCTTT